MKSHPYLRAYMAGVLLPNWVFLLVLPVFVFGHVENLIPAQIRHVIMFPMAVVPNLWGLWNVLYQRFASRRMSLGAFGALLPLILVPAGVALTSALDFRFYTSRDAAIVLPCAMAIYYLAWKYVVGFFNRVADLRS